MSEAFVKTLKRDYARVTPLPDEQTVLRLVDGRITDYNTASPHSAHGELTPAGARNRAAADRLRSMAVSADRPLPTTQRTGYAIQGLSE